MEGDGRGEVHDAVIQQRHAHFEGHRHAHPVHLGQDIVRQVHPQVLMQHLVLWSEPCRRIEMLLKAIRPTPRHGLTDFRIVERRAHLRPETGLASAETLSTLQKGVGTEPPDLLDEGRPRRESQRRVHQSTQS